MSQINFKQYSFLEKALGEYYKNNFTAFVKDWFEDYKGLPFRPHYSVSYVLEHVELNVKGDIERLLVSLPRGWGKSIICSELAPAWALLRDPKERIGCFSRALTEDAKMWHGASAKIMNLDITKRFFPGQDNKLTSESAIIFKTQAGGYRKIGSCLSSSVGSDMTFAVVDDPADQEHYRSEAKRIRLENFFAKSLLRAVRTTNYEESSEYLKQLTESQRAEYKLTKLLEEEAKDNQFINKRPRLLLTMQRLHIDDPIGMFLNINKQMVEQNIQQSFEYIKVPAIHEKYTTYFLPISKETYIAEEGEYTLAGTLSKESIDKARIEMLEDDFQAQMQQNPAVKSGVFFKKEWIKYIDNITHLPFTQIYLSFDTAYKTEDWNDPTACVVFGVQGKSIYVLESVVKKVEYSELKQLVYRMIANYKHQAPVCLLIEDKGSGQSLIQDLNKEDIPNVIPVKAKGSKEERLQQAIQSLKIVLEAGNFILPRNAHWKVDYENELLSFPNVKHDDQLDATVHFMNYYSTGLNPLNAESIIFHPLN